MPAVVVDTHTIVWYLSADPRLSETAAEALDSATAAGELIHVPSICLVELTYLVEKGRLPAAARNRLIEALDDPATPCLLAPLDRSVADALESVSRNEIPDLPDRIVTATAVALRVPLISRDGKIRASQIQNDLVTSCRSRRLSTFSPALMNHFQSTRASQPSLRCYSHADALFRPTSRQPLQLSPQVGFVLQKNKIAPPRHAPFHPSCQQPN
jgi:PIN domain nuclease of toxin-antitoxin system